MIAASTGSSRPVSGDFVRSTIRSSARPFSARSITWPIAPWPMIATRTRSHGLRARESLTQRVEFGVLHRERMLGVRERPRADLRVEGLQRVDDLRADVGVPLREF